MNELGALFKFCFKWNRHLTTNLKGGVNRNENKTDWLKKSVPSSSVSTAEASDAAVYFESKRGGTKMSYKGFVYNEDRQGKARIYWRCQSRRCKGN